MSVKVLVAYASRTGSTAETASVIAECLLQAGVDAELSRMNRVVTLRPYEAVVLGAPLYAGSFPGEARSFLLRHREPLSRLTPWFFALGPTRPEPDDYEAARQQALEELAQYPWLRLSELKIFGGRLSASDLPFPYSLLRRLHAMPLHSSDQRDWTAIRHWAREMVSRIQISSFVIDSRYAGSNVREISAGRGR